MSWLSSILIGVLTAALGCVGAGFLAIKCVRWYRISSFEGASGYYVVLIAFFGIVAGLIVGIICARLVGSWPAPTFMKGLGVGFGSMTGLVLSVGLLAWLAADLEPELNGNSVELAIEVRGPVGFTIPTELDKNGAYAYVYAPGGRSQPTGELRLKEAVEVNGRWIVPATVPLRTSIRDKYVRAYFNKQNDALFSLRLPRRLSTKETEWSGWVESGWDVGKPEPPPEGKFGLRFRVLEILPEPPGPTEAELAAKEEAEKKAAFEAIPADAPLTAWLPYTRYGLREDWRTIAIGHMTARESFVNDLAQLMNADDAEVASDALRVIEHIPQPPATLNQAVEDSGRRIAEFIRTKNATTAEQDPSYLWAAEASTRFSAWMVAVRGLREKAGGDFTAPLRDILELSRIRTDSYCMQTDIRRVASYYMQQWTGLEPAPGDPKPR